MSGIRGRNLLEKEDHPSLLLRVSSAYEQWKPHAEDALSDVSDEGRLPDRPMTYDEAMKFFTTDERPPDEAPQQSAFGDCSAFYDNAVVETDFFDMCGQHDAVEEVNKPVVVPPAIHGPRRMAHEFSTRRIYVPIKDHPANKKRRPTI